MSLCMHKLDMTSSAVAARKASKEVTLHSPAASRFITRRQSNANSISSKDRRRRWQRELTTAK